MSETEEYPTLKSTKSDVNVISVTFIVIQVLGYHDMMGLRRSRNDGCDFTGVSSYRMACR